VNVALAFVIRAALSGIIIAVIALVSRRLPGLGALIASLPLISMLGIIWLWRDTGDRELLASHIGATFWYVLPSLPMFVLMPWMLRHGWSVWLTLSIGVVVTMLLYVAMNRILASFGVTL
jgi:hypothetical protein